MKNTALSLLNMVLPVITITFGEKFTGAGSASIFIASTPVWTAILSHFAGLSQSSGLWLAGCFALAITGEVLIVVDQLSKEGNYSIGVTIFGYVLLLLGAMSYAAGAVVAKKLCAKQHAVLSASGQTLVSVFFATLIAIPADVHEHGADYLSKVTAVSWGGVLYQGVGATCLAFYMYFVLIGRMGPQLVSCAFMTFPIYGMIEAAFLFDSFSFSSFCCRRLPTTQN